MEGVVAVGKIDAESRKYLSVNQIFADAFNYLIYDGDQVILPEKLRTVDTTEIAIPYGNNSRVPVQKYRDTMKIWAAMEDEYAVYVLLGGEAQSHVHYAMPVKDMLYDALNYAAQVDEARRSYRKKAGVDKTGINNAVDRGELVFEENQLKIRLTAEEFLSGFRKGDKLIPVITAVIYFGPEKWDGPTSIREMVKVPDKRMLRAIPDYFINLIAPAEIDDGDFDKFHTDLGFAMKVIKHQKDDAVEIIKATDHRKIDRNTAEFLNTVANLNLVYDEAEEEVAVDMCKAMEDYTKKTEIIGAIKVLRSMGTQENEIVAAIIKQFEVTAEYVKALMQPQAV